MKKNLIILAALTGLATTACLPTSGEESTTTEVDTTEGTEVGAPALGKGEAIAALADGLALEDNTAPTDDTAAISAVVIDPGSEKTGDVVEVLDSETATDDSSDENGGNANNGLVAQFKWLDDLRQHDVELSEEADPVNVNPEDGIARKLLDASHYLKTPGAEKELVANVAESTDNCTDGDLIDRFYPETFEISDVNNDGIEEATFLYAQGCVTDIGGEVTAAMLTDDKTYTISGIRNTTGELSADNEPDLQGQNTPEDPQQQTALLNAWRATL